MHLNLFNYAEMLALVVSIIYFKSIRHTPFAILLPYMIMIICVEITGKYLLSKHLYVQNLHIFNVSTVIEFVVFYYLFHANLKTHAFKKLALYCIPLYVILAVINQVFIQGFDRFHIYTMIIGSLFLIAFVFLYFYEAFSSMEPVYLFKEPMFWIAVGLFLFYLGDFTYNAMVPFFIKKRLFKDAMHLFRLINNNLIIFEYVCFSIAIITCSKIRRGSNLQSLPLL